MQLPRQMTTKPFGEVNVWNEGQRLKIKLTILMKPQGDDALGWQTGLALDASQSMKGWYGRSGEGQLPPEIENAYMQKGWIEYKMRDGKKIKSYKKEGLNQALRDGHLRYSRNIVEPVARELIAYLAREVDADGGTTMIYWACGGDGSDFEVYGDVTETQAPTLQIRGPKAVSFGNGTILTPAVQYFVKRFRDAKYGMYVFLTDGKLDDLEEVKAYTARLCREIEVGKRNPIKCILIGVGNNIDEAQMEQLDDLDSGTSVDIWDHKLYAEMDDLTQLFSEPINPDMLVAAHARIYDSSGNAIVDFREGLKAEIEFYMPSSSPWFELEVAGMPERIRQSVIPPKR